MHDAISLISRHGYLVLFLAVLAEAIGLPVPAALALITAGTAVASHVLNGPMVLLVGLAAMLLGDSFLYWIGRKTGWALLGFLCKLAINPETCILRSAESFYKRGKLTLVLAKFIPGVNTMAPPLAGSMKMSYGQFLSLDSAGTLLYLLAYATLGFAFSDLLRALASGLQTAERVVELGVAIAFFVYV